MAYSLVLVLHSWIRWIVLVLAVIALVRSIPGWRQNRAWTATDRKVQLGLVSAFDLQALFGLLLLFPLSPITKIAFSDFGAAMKDAMLRFFAMEHPLLMLIALAVAHVSSVRARKASGDPAKHRIWAIGVIVALVLVAIAIPWPHSATHGRPLFRVG